jgi:diguanylate cyclase (GGDEF)-like protein
VSQLELFPGREVVTVLIVDEDESAVETISAELAGTLSVQYHTVSASSADQAAEMIGSEAPDAIVLGVAADTLAGIDWLGRLRLISQAIPIVVVHHSSEFDTSLETVITAAQDVLSLSEATSRRLDRAIRAAIARKRAESEALATAFADPVTGLGSRRWVRDRLDRALNHAAGSGTGWQVAVLFCDLDRFKLVNDTFGHARGDELLRAVADRLRRVVRADDPLARYGGDEFMIIVEGYRIDGLAHRIGLRALAAFKEPFSIAGHQFPVMSSVGLVVAEPGDRAETVLAHADAALYAAKQGGRNRLVAFDETLRDRVARESRSAVDLAYAIESNRLELAHQDFNDLRVGTTIGSMVSAAWPGGPLAETDSIEALAQRSGLGPDLARWLVRRALGELVEGKRANRRGLLFVRLPAGLVKQPAVVEWLTQQLLALEVDAGDLCLLISEEEFAEGELIRPTLEAFAAAGVNIGLDGFGAGTASLTLFASDLVDYVALAPEMVKGIGTESFRQQYLSGLVDIADAVGQQLIAVGVSDLRDIDMLAGIGVHFVVTESSAPNSVIDVRDNVALPVS